MEVTKSNFQDVLPEIETAIKNCTFIGIDCELTGLKTALNNINAFDTPKQYYEKVVRDCREFLTIQYGLTLFRYDEVNDVFKHTSYNFYIFRRPLKNFLEDQRFLCQTSSIDFLIGQGFDFNKLFKEGIPYLNNAEEDIYRSKLDDVLKKMKNELGNCHQNYDIIPIPDEHKEFIEDIVQKLESFVSSDDTELQLPKCNAFVRRLIYQTNQEKFGYKMLLETRLVDKERILFATRIKSIEEREEIERKKCEEMSKTLEDCIGFSKVIRKVIESEKLVVGHNILLDFLHTIHKFVTPLCDDYTEFKDCASSLFPKILDTKYMSSTETFKSMISSTVLSHLLNSVLEKPFELPKCEVEDGCLGYKISDEKEHEAGYDSFMTGVSALGMWKYLGSKKNLPNSEIFGKKGMQLLSPYLNKIFLMFLTDSQYINLTGEDLNPSREHVFYLTFPKEWSVNTIQQLFSPFGGIHIAFISETSAFVALVKRQQAAVALKTLSQSDTYSIMTFAKRNALLAGLRSIAPSPIKKRKSKESLPQTKRRKTASFDGGSCSQSKRSIDPIEEEEEGGNSKYTFKEVDQWD